MWQADELEILVLVENWVDMLLPDQTAPDGNHCVTRAGLIHHFDPNQTPPQAENGLSLLVRATRGRYTSTVLFDVGMTGTVLAHNLRVLGEDPAGLDHVVISHGHPDHYGGLHHLLGLRERPIPVATHPDAFLPRHAVMGDGRTATYYNEAFRRDAIDLHGGRLVESREPLELGYGMLTTGEIPRLNDFEGPPAPATPRSPGLYQVDRQGAVVPDEVWDEQGLIIDVKDQGLVVLTGCAHAGALNTLHRARELVGDRPIRALIGGFHLGFPTTPAENISRTVEALRELDVQTIMPMHCSGLHAHAAFTAALSDRYVQPAVGTRLHFP